MKIYKITAASEYLGVSINTLKALANNGKVKSFKTTIYQKIAEMLVLEKSEKVDRGADFVEFRLEIYSATPVKFWEIVNREAERIADCYNNKRALQ